MRSHPLEHALNADAVDILSAIQKGFRAIIDVKGKLAEYFLLKEFDRLKEKGLVTQFVWTDKDGQPDFFVECTGGHHLKIECKNIRSGQLFRSPPRYRVELQKTRNSKDGQIRADIEGTNLISLLPVFSIRLSVGNTCLSAPLDWKLGQVKLNA